MLFLRSIQLGGIYVLHWALVLGFASHDTTPKLFENIPYCFGGATSLELDVAVPMTKSGPFPVVLLIHGGGWSVGSRRSYKKVLQQFTDSGFVAVAADYRLSSHPFPNDRTPDKFQVGASFPAQLEDLKCAIRWIRANAAQYSMNPDSIGVMGRESGAHLGLLLGLTSPSDGFEGSGGHEAFSSSVQAIVNWHGATDLKRRFLAQIGDSDLIQSTLARLIQTTPNENPDAYDAASPLKYVRANSPPILTLHNPRDVFDPISQSESLAKRCDEVGAPHEFVSIESEGPGFRGPNFDKAMRLSLKFLRRVLRAP